MLAGRVAPAEAARDLRLLQVADELRQRNAKEASEILRTELTTLARKVEQLQHERQHEGRMDALQLEALEETHKRQEQQREKEQAVELERMQRAHDESLSLLQSSLSAKESLAATLSPNAASTIFSIARVPIKAIAMLTLEPMSCRRNCRGLP